MAIYRVQVPDKDGKPMHERLVDAPNQASARGHVARSLFKVEVVKTVDAFKLAQAGVQLETVTAAQAAVTAAEETPPGATGDGQQVDGVDDDKSTGSKTK